MSCSRNESCYIKSCSPSDPGTPPFPPLGALIVFSLTPVLIIIIAVKCCITAKKKKKRKLREKLAEYERVQTRQDLPPRQVPQQVEFSGLGLRASLSVTRVPIPRDTNPKKVAICHLLKVGKLPMKTRKKPSPADY